MFERFTVQAREIVRLSQEIARARAHTSIEIGHLQLAVASVGPSIATLALEELDETTSALEAAIDSYEADPRGVTTGQIPFADPAKRTLELSLREALSLGHNYIGPEHLLLALTRMESLLAWGTVEPIRDAVIRILSRPRPPLDHLVSWTPAMESAGRVFLETTTATLDLLALDAVAVTDLARSLDVAVEAGEAFREAIRAISLRKR